jgi:uncharacterized caspase-like protein
MVEARFRQFAAILLHAVHSCDKLGNLCYPFEKPSIAILERGSAIILLAGARHERAMVGLLSRVAIAVVSAILLIAPCGVAQAERRVALVMGNSDYTVARISLPNPKNDAQDITAALKELDFEVITAVNANKRDMDLKLAEFARKSTDADAALFYYAGHAMQLQGRNFLMPVDAELEDEFSVQYQMVGLDYVRAALDRVNGVKIMILDACRNNPLANRMIQRTVGLSRSVAETTRGLARIDKTQGMVIAYATAVDDVAEDGDGRNSPFTSALLRRLREPGLEIATMFRRVASDVNAQTGGRQRPELTINLLDDYFLNQSDRIAWERTNQDDAEALRNFISRYPSSPHAVFARNRLDLMERYAKEREEQRKAAEDAQRRVAEEAQRKAAEETRRKAAEEAQRKTAEEAQHKAIEEARRKAAAEETQRKAAEEAQRKAAEEAQRKVAEEAQRKVAEEAQRKVAEEAQRKAAEEAQRKLADEAQRKGTEEAQRKVAEAQRKTADEAQRKAAEEAQRLAAQREAEERQRAEQQAALERKRVEEERQRADLFKLQAAEQKRQEEQRVAALQQQQAEQQRIDAQKRLGAQEDAARKRIQETCDREQAKLDQFKSSQAGGADVRTDLKKFEIEASCNSLRPLIADMIASLATVSSPPTGPANPPAMPAAPAPAAQAANTVDQVLKAQQELKRLGCFVSKPDGKLSRATETAVKSYWTHTGQTVTEIKITDEFLSDIEQHDKPVCDQPVIASRPPPARPREDVAPAPRHVQKAAPAETPRAPVALARPAPAAPAPAAPRPAVPTAHAITGIGM